MKIPSDNPHRGIRRGRSGNWFRPHHIPGCQLFLWASSPAGYNTALPADTAQISAWSDLSGNGRDASQGTASLRPVMNYAGIGSKPGVFYDGTDDYVTVADHDDFSLLTSGGADRGATWAFAFQMTSHVHFSLMSKDNGLTDEEWVCKMDGSGQPLCRIRDSGDDFIQRSAPTISALVGEPVVLVFTYDGSESVTGIKIYQDGLQVDDTSAVIGVYDGAYNSIHPVYVGADVQAGNNANGDIGVAAYWNRELTVGERRRVERWLGAYYGVGVS